MQLLAAAAATVALLPAPLPPPAAPQEPSRAVGKPYAGKLVNGVLFPAETTDSFSWDPPLRRSPSRDWRRWGTDTTVATTLRVIAEYRAEHPDAPRVGVGDLSRPDGGVFDRRYGGLGHQSHQNGLDVDVYYPRKDRLERSPREPSQVDQELSQALVDAFVQAGAQKVFVGPRLSLRGPRKVVSKLVHHDDHLHVRFRP